MGCSPWGRKELDTIEHACMHERVKEASHASILRKSAVSRGKNKSKVTEPEAVF